MSMLATLFFRFWFTGLRTSAILNVKLTPSMLAIGELYMVGLPKFKFDLLTWRIFDPFINYGHVMMLHTMKNLVANDLLLCSERKHIELRLNDISLESPLGLVGRLF